MTYERNFGTIQENLQLLQRDKSLADIRLTQPIVIEEIPETSLKFGTFAGVFTPTTLTILGAVMYLREGWVVGNAGLGGAILIILLSNIITLTTGLSIATIATNIRVRAGGAFSIISQSLGLEVGGSVSVPLYLAQAISVAFYIFAFSEGWLRIFPDHSQIIVISVAFLLSFLIAYISANVAARAQMFILFIIFASLISVAGGSFPVNGQAGFTETPQLWGNFADGNFWQIFAVFFPAVTGVLAGVNMSGVLENPRKSIPQGTIAAIVLCAVIYLSLAVWLAKVATPAELMSNFTIIVDKALVGELILAGILAATFSSALTSLVGAPRVLQAIAEHDIVPFGKTLARTNQTDEPRPAMFVTGAIAILSILFGLVGGGLNAIAPLMTMFFLITYAVLNGVVLLEQSLGLVSFRPIFSVPRFVPFVGLVGCLFVMFLINPIFSLVALSVIVALYIYLARRHLTAPWSDVRSGLFVTFAEWAAKRVTAMPTSQERAWKPNVLVPVSSTDDLLGNYRFLHSIIYPRGALHVVGIYPPHQREQVAGLPKLTRAYSDQAIYTRLALLEAEDFADSLKMGLDLIQSAFFRPNALFIAPHGHFDESLINDLLKRLKKHKMGGLIFRLHPVSQLGREKTINVWIREQSPAWEIALRMTNLDLALLIAYQIQQNWHGQIRLITVVRDKTDEKDAQTFLNQLIDLGRMPRQTEAVVGSGDFKTFVKQAPQADLNIFGIADTVSLSHVQQMVEITHSSCLFVQDSGQESALA